MQTSTAGMHMRGGEQFKNGGKVKGLKTVRQNIARTPEGLFEGDMLLKSPEGKFYAESGKSKLMQLALDKALHRAQQQDIADSLTTEIAKQRFPEYFGIKKKAPKKKKKLFGLFKKGGKVKMAKGWHV